MKRDSILTAAESGKLNRLKGLADTVMSIKDDNGVGVIHFAAEEGHINVLKYLIDELGLDVNMKNDATGQSPLYHAVLGGNINTVDYLLGKGANPSIWNTNGGTPLHYAAQKGYTEILTRLLSRGVNVNGLCEDGTLTPLVVAGATVAPLELAAKNGQLEAIQILLDHNADPNLVSCRSYTPLTVSIIYGLPQSLQYVELLLEAGADPDGGSHGVSPLIVATHKGLTEIIKCLIQAGANPDVTNCFGLTPLEIAAVRGYRHNVEILFPVTSRIPEYIDWSVDGVIRHVHSDQAKEQEQDYYKAIFWYSQASEISPCDAKVLSNRSMCWARLKNGESALETANAYYRAGVAYNLLKRYSCAQNAFLDGLKLSPNNQELKDAFREAVEAQLTTL
ncbi:hypothetical protein MKX01_007613 [Papaver californicum]|nr:hypothetical protein MKX01_007613 [Papaver californicum]